MGYYHQVPLCILSRPVAQCRVPRPSHRIARLTPKNDLEALGKRRLEMWIFDKNSRWFLWDLKFARKSARALEGHLLQTACFMTLSWLKGPSFGFQGTGSTLLPPSLLYVTELSISSLFTPTTYQRLRCTPLLQA